MKIDKDKTEYERYLQEAHNRVALPVEILEEVVGEATGSVTEVKEKILKGEANQVFDITTKDRQQIIARVAKSEEPQFLQEQWAIEQCRRVGVPVPEIMLIRHFTLDSGLYSVCIQKKLEGDTLERGDIDMNSLGESELKGLMFQAGEVLSKIHSSEEPCGRDHRASKTSLSLDQITSVV